MSPHTGATTPKTHKTAQPLFSILAVFSQPRGNIRNPLLALWEGQAQELSFFKEAHRILVGSDRREWSQLGLPAYRRARIR